MDFKHKTYAHLAPEFVLHSAESYERHVAMPTPVGQIPAEWSFVINSMPKSGTLWVAAMLSAALPENAQTRVNFSHACDGPSELTAHGIRCVVLVRDLRDIVVSWFHETRRNDLRAGYDVPRFASVETFYFEHLLGLLRTSPRFGQGNLEPWLDFVSARAFPILRFEDLLARPEKSLAKVMTFWKIRIPSEKIVKIAKAHHFETMARARGGGSVPVERWISEGHLHRGRCGDWRSEMSGRVERDISARFAIYQERLGYA
ncbi:sulfotransferase domain-containing protein [Paracoccus sp. YLB-12]|uniref:Sulfotransferase domain-containing protein n=1 Tax=Paracoccus maritimus TaxID=2933292 RepID=A0ABT2KCX5_9RHOB|nr:sulfotransferase domain-containing protein [Paracoccus sp. YLB-12]MCT4334398.1 sulfotransferase domain-containing protein [Paracoccus sp. YLB-12]